MRVEVLERQTQKEIALWTSGNAKGQIVETFYTAGKWVMLRTREDKSMPNSIFQLTSLYKAERDDITLSRIVDLFRLQGACR